MRWIDVTILRFVEEHQPGIIECEFEDAGGQFHRIIDKCWIFTEQSLGSDSAYPVAGMCRCRILRMQRDGFGRDLAIVTIAEPDGLESTEGETEMIMLASQVFDG